MFDENEIAPIVLHKNAWNWICKKQENNNFAAFPQISQNVLFENLTCIWQAHGREGERGAGLAQAEQRLVIVIQLTDAAQFYSLVLAEVTPHKKPSANTSNSNQSQEVLCSIKQYCWDMTFDSM